MKTKRLSWIVLIVACVIAIALIALEQYYVVIALIIGILIMRHRELWSLIRTGKLPPVDERVRENTGPFLSPFMMFTTVRTRKDG